MGSRLYADQGEIKMQIGLGDIDALGWVVAPAEFVGTESEFKKQVEEINKDARKAFAGVFQLFLQGHLGGETRAGVLAMTGGLENIQRVALRGPGDVFLVMAALTYAQAAVAKFGNIEFASASDPALIEYVNKCKAAESELLKVPMDFNYSTLANWCGGNGGLVKEGFRSWLGLVDYVAMDVAELFGWDNNQYLNPEQITDTSSGQAVNTKVAMVKLKAQSPWCAYWIQERVFGKALNKQASQQKATEKAQVKVMQKVAETTDEAANTLSAMIDALNKAQKNLQGFLSTLGEWIVPIALGIGGVWLLFTFAPAIVRKTGETQAALSEVRARKKR